MIRLIFILILILTGAVDAATKKIYNFFPLAIGVLSIWNFSQYPDMLLSGIIGFFALSVPLLALTLLRGGLGGGDIKLTAACGLFLGVDALLIGFFSASLLALAACLVRWLCRDFLHREQKQHSVFAFGPYLAAGFILAAMMA